MSLGKEEFIKALAREVRQKRLPRNPERAARELFDVPPRSGWYRYTQREGVVPLDRPPAASQWSEVDRHVTQGYLRFCEALGRPSDCRQVLMNSPVLTGDGRYALGMSFAVEEIIPEMMQSFKEMADPEALQAALYWTMTIYAAMWLAPEPVFSKGLATVVTASFVCYIGVDTLWTLIQGWRRMVEELDHAKSFEAIREAGRKYGRVMGKNAARAFALLLTAAIGQTAASFSAKVPTLPGSAQASAAGARMGVKLTEVAQVESVVVTADAVTIALAPTAAAMTGQGPGGGSMSAMNASGGGGGGGSSTPGGRKLTEHAQESLRRHGLKEPFSQVDDIIENYTRTTTQADGATVYIQRAGGSGRSYNIAIVNEQGEIVTAMLNLDPKALRKLGQNYGFNPDP